MENKKKEKNTHTHVYLSHFLYRRNYHNTVSKLYFSEKTNLLLLSFSRQVVYDSLPSNHLILCHPFLLLPSIFPSIRVFSSELSADYLCPTSQKIESKRLFKKILPVAFR